MKKILVLLCIVIIANFHIQKASQCGMKEFARLQMEAQEEENKKKCIQYLTENETIVCMDTGEWKHYITNSKNFRSFFENFGDIYLSLAAENQVIIDNHKVSNANDANLNFIHNMIFFNKIFTALVRKDFVQLETQNKQLMDSINFLHQTRALLNGSADISATELQKAILERRQITLEELGLMFREEWERNEKLEKANKKLKSKKSSLNPTNQQNSGINIPFILLSFLIVGGLYSGHVTIPFEQQRRQIVTVLRSFHL